MTKNFNLTIKKIEIFPCYRKRRLEETTTRVRIRHTHPLSAQKPAPTYDTICNKHIVIKFKKYTEARKNFINPQPHYKMHSTLYSYQQNISLLTSY